MYASKLIWPRDYVAPYESGWSILARIMILNGLKPKDVYHLISNGSCNYENISLTSPSWIDFKKLSRILDVNEYKLKSRFFKQWWDDKYNINSQHKVCTKCLKIGYHTSLFDLHFVDKCPWHNSELINCYTCYISVINSGFIRSEIVSENIIWPKWTTLCKHVDINDKDIASIFTITNSDRKIINFNCNELVRWLSNINRAEPQLFFEFCFSKQRNKEIHNLLFSAAEVVAGRYPWPLINVSNKIKLLRWNETDACNKSKDLALGDFVGKKNTVWGEIYKSISHHIFNNYIKPHKRCWNEVIHYDLVDFQYLNCNKICKVSLAYSIWVLLNEDLFNLNYLKNKRKRKSNILAIFILHYPSSFTEITTKSITAYGNILYALFFSIWNELILQKSFSIQSNKRKIYTIDYIQAYENVDNISIVIPHSDVLNGLTERCKKISKIQNFMLLENSPLNNHCNSEYFHSHKFNWLCKARPNYDNKCEFTSLRF